ncbi:hypothetical protein J6590_020217 [Homalodisca vitripennis]|nr:hypothetical protein J6590_020217 [Homalodisca vitripennis]
MNVSCDVSTSFFIPFLRPSACSRSPPRLCPPSTLNTLSVARLAPPTLVIDIPAHLLAISARSAAAAVSHTHTAASAAGASTCRDRQISKQHMLDGRGEGRINYIASDRNYRTNPFFPKWHLVDDSLLRSPITAVDIPRYLGFRRPGPVKS